MTEIAANSENIKADTHESTRYRTKAEHIRALYARGWSCPEIAAVVDCHPDYVRVAVRQRKAPRFMAPGMSNTEVYHALPKAERSRVCREVYTESIASGAGYRQAKSAAKVAVMKRARRYVAERALEAAQ